MENTLDPNSQTPLISEPAPVLSNNSNILKLIIVLLLILLPMVGAGAYYLGTQNTPLVAVSENNSESLTSSPSPISDIEVGCTLEAMVCPDGSSVGRSGPNCEFEACPSPTSDSLNTVIYEGKLNPFIIAYPYTYRAEASEANDGDQIIEQVIFVDENNPINFSIRVDKNVKILPQYLYDQLPTGEYELDGVKGIYLEMPDGYGDGGNWTPQPETYLSFIYDGREYRFSFFGVSDINDPDLQAILNGFSFNK